MPLLARTGFAVDGDDASIRTAALRQPIGDEQRLRRRREAEVRELRQQQEGDFAHDAS